MKLVKFDPEHDTYDFLVNGDWHYWDYAKDFQTRAGVLGSLLHLFEKTWFTTEHARQLLTLLQQHSVRRMAGALSL
jgi:hypothetical protein